MINWLIFLKSIFDNSIGVIKDFVFSVVGFKFVWFEWFFKILGFGVSG